MKMRSSEVRNTARESVRERPFTVLALFAIAMGFLEAIVVVYLRQIYYPGGFTFPLAIIPPQMLVIEWVRELATVIMLVTVGMLAGRDALQRLLYFLYSFAVWDIFYYVALWLFLGWPQSLLTWDLLFLIPVPWLGPVIAPVICSLTMIFMAFTMNNVRKKGRMVKISVYNWLMIFGGALIIFMTFIRDYLKIMTISGDLLPAGDHDRQTVIAARLSSYIPGSYSWGWFILGETIIILSVFMILKQSKTTTNHEQS